MVKLLKREFDIFALQKTQGVNRWTTKAQRTRTRSTTFKQNINPDRTKTISFTNRKMTERGDGWMTVGGWIQNKAIRKDAVKMVEATVQLGAISPRRAKKCKSRR